MTKRIGIISPVKLSALEKKLIALVQQNARISLSSLSHYLRRPKATIIYHMEGLQKKGVIQGLKTHFSLFRPVIHYAVILLHINGPTIQQTQDELSKDPHCISIMSINGPSNTFFFGAFTNKREVEAYAHALVTRYSISLGACMEMTDYDFSIINYTREKVDIDVATHVRDLSFQNEFKGRQRTQSLPTQEDLPILLAIADNPRASLSTLAQEIHMAKVTVKKRLKRLIQEGVIAKFSASVNPHCIEGIIFVIVWSNMQAGDREKLKKMLNKEGIGNGVATLSGAWNTAAFMHFHSKTEWVTFERNFVRTFPSVSDYRIDIVHEQYKLDWLPPFIRERLGAPLYAAKSKPINEALVKGAKS